MKSLIFNALGLFIATASLAKDYVITDFGAKPDGKTLCTEAVQKAIDACTKAGGGRVIVPNGTYIIGSIFIKDNTTLYLEPTAVLAGSPDIKHYKELVWGGDGNIDRQPYHLINAHKAKNIGIAGTGTIDGRGEAFWEPQPLRPRWVRAKKTKVSPMVEIRDCEDVRISDVKITNPAGWTVHLHDVTRAWIKGIKIDNDLYTPNSDGIDLTGCEDVMISDCYISTCDDAICLKTSPDSRECKRVTVTNCVIRTNCVGLKLGNESYRDMSQITFSNCVVYGSNRAIGIYSKDGGKLEDIFITNIVSDTKAPLVLARPIHISLTQKNTEGRLGEIKNVYITNFKSTSPGRILLTAAGPNALENIVLKEVNLTFPYIEDPMLYAPEATSAQFSPGSEEAKRAKYAVIADNIKYLEVDGLRINWPGKETPKDWQFPEMIENGSVRVHKPNFSNPRQTEFGVFWGKNLNGGYCRTTTGTMPSVATVKPFELIDSKFEFK